MSATALIRDHAGRFTPRRPIPVCAGCGWTLAEDLTGRLYCPATRCEHYRQPVDVAPGVDPGVLTAADLEVRS